MLMTVVVKVVMMVEMVVVLVVAGGDGGGGGADGCSQSRFRIEGLGPKSSGSRGLEST